MGPGLPCGGRRDSSLSTRRVERFGQNVRAAKDAIWPSIRGILDERLATAGALLEGRDAAHLSSAAQVAKIAAQGPGIAAPHSRIAAGDQQTAAQDERKAALPSSVDAEAT